MDFFFDESKHPSRGGFVLGAFVGTEDNVAPAVSAALAAEGLVPGKDEYKSSSNMSAQPAQARVRERLRTVLSGGRIALVVLPCLDLPSLGEEALSALKKLVARYDWPTGTTHRVFFDQQVFPSQAAADQIIKAALLPKEIQAYAEQDSRQVFGLQLADLASHTCAMMLLEQLGLVTKQVEASYPDEGKEPLGRELWHSCRWGFFSKPPRTYGIDEPIDLSVQVSGYGLFISDRCSAALRDAAEARFGEMYLGCTH